MASFQDLTTTRPTVPDPASLLAQLRSLDASAGVAVLSLTLYRVKKETAWTGPQIAAAQNAIDTAPASSPQLAAQAWIDAMPLGEKAFVLALIDQLNVLRGFHSLAAITPAQAISAIRAKAGTL